MYKANTPGVYILENTLPPWGGGISADVIWGKKYEKGKRKRGKCKRKRKKGKKKEERKEKRRKGKENEKRGRKGVKEMQNREEFRQKGHDRSRKTTCRERGKNIIFRRGGGNKYRFQTKI
jgi:hypothetical protein